MAEDRVISESAIKAVLKRFYENARHAHESSDTDEDRDFAYHAMNCTQSIATRLGIEIDW